MKQLTEFVLRFITITEAQELGLRLSPAHMNCCWVKDETRCGLAFSPNGDAIDAIDRYIRCNNITGQLRDGLYKVRSALLLDLTIH